MILEKKISRGGRSKRSKKRLVHIHRDSVYHVVSRMACKQWLFDDKGKEVIANIIKRQSRFSGVEVLAFCVMSNHFHLLVKVPKRPILEDGVIIKRYRALYAGTRVPPYAIDPDSLPSILKSGGEHAESARALLTARMHNLSTFVGEIKQRFSIWYNCTHENEGTLWEGRFHSQLIEDSGRALSLVAAYIHLNPVRAGIVENPSDYLFSSFSQAVKGNSNARNGLVYCAKETDWEHAYLSHCALMSRKVASSEAQAVAPKRRAWQDALHQKIRYFSDALAIGSRPFIESVYSEFPDVFQSDRKRRPHKLKWILEEDLRVARDLRKNVVT